ncbi:hypothetical protein E4Q23_07660 [Candidatus Accumulibacter phosphatis]|uniref:Uncharacterized protein n=1 Tax=Candidatus Accumulibacter phosphatis TaxID=327160 RepID=A0ABX1TY42_9PROT|nr:hypothetical protein [Candidatus Accumulibacter phosphatis]NMQ27640.1 hypothetical protein [Candidatus Accumulibacter phosphatis]
MNLKLYGPRKNTDFTIKLQQKTFITSREIELYKGAPVWALPTSPTWRENPFGINTWMIYYNSLGWMNALLYDGVENGNVDSLSELKILLFDFFARQSDDS